MMNAWVATPTCMALTKSMLRTLPPNSTNSWHLWIRQVKMQLAFTQALCMSLSWKLQLRNLTSSSRPDPRPTHPPTESRIDKLVKRPTQSYSRWPLLTVSWLWLLLSTLCKREWMDSSIFRSFQEWSWKPTGLVTLFSTYSNGRCSWLQPLSFGLPLVLSSTQHGWPSSCSHSALYPLPIWRRSCSRLSQQLRHWACWSTSWLWESLVLLFLRSELSHHSK